jgi:hypothetical protein
MPQTLLAYLLLQSASVAGSFQALILVNKTAQEP